MKSRFWNKVERCKHENADSTSTVIHCATEYSYAREKYCPDCKAYIVECSCGCCNDISGWSELRWRKMRRRSQLKDRRNHA